MVVLVDVRVDPDGATCTGPVTAGPLGAGVSVARTLAVGVPTSLRGVATVTPVARPETGVDDVVVVVVVVVVALARGVSTGAYGVLAVAPPPATTTVLPLEEGGVEPPATTTVLPLERGAVEPPATTTALPLEGGGTTVVPPVATTTVPPDEGGGLSTITPPW